MERYQGYIKSNVEEVPQIQQKKKCNNVKTSSDTDHTKSDVEH